MAKVKSDLAWNKEKIREALLAKDENVWSATVMLYRKQTASEQEHSESTQRNGVGFNKRDARFMTSLAEQIIRNKQRGYRYLLSEKQTEYARRIIWKYAGQLAKIANGEL